VKEDQSDEINLFMTGILKSSDPYTNCNRSISAVAWPNAWPGIECGSLGKVFPVKDIVDACSDGEIRVSFF